MSTETQTGENGATLAGAQTLTVTDNRTGQTYELPITDGTIRAPRPAPDQDRRRRLRPDDLRPGVHEHRVVPRRRSRSSTATRASSSTAATRSSSSRRSRLPRGRLPARPRRAADAAAARRRGRTRSRSTRSCTRTSRSFMQGFRHDAHPMGMLLGAVGALSTFYPDAKNIDDAESRRLADDPPDREDADARRVRLPAHRTGMPYVYPDNDLSYAGQLPRDAVQDDRAQVRARSAARARARHPLHPARRPRAELLDERGAVGRLARSVDPYSAVAAGVAALYGPLARRRQRGRAEDARAHRHGRGASPLHRGREGRRTSA